MHISDLHRYTDSSLSNDEIISSLIQDSRRYVHESPPISLPNAVVVSGDLILGLPLHSPLYPIEIEKQYSLVMEFLSKLAQTFTQNDRSRIIIVPGNHDVDWNRVDGALEEIDCTGKDIETLLAQPNSPYRWSWKERKLFKVINYQLYQERFKYFCDFYSNFYENTNLVFKVDPARNWNLFRLNEGKILLCAFNSCVFNDCYNAFGEIPGDAIAQSDLADSGDYLLKIAVWHHDVQGGPRRSDYLDSATIQILIDKGYRIGLHGHKHISGTVPFTLHTSAEGITAVIIGAGALSADIRHLPHGINRQYNMLQIFDNYEKGRLHVREETVPDVFAPGRLMALGGLSYADLKWDRTQDNQLVNIGRGGGEDIISIEQIEEDVSKGRFDLAISKIQLDRDHLGIYGRQLLSKGLFDAKEWRRLLTFLSSPQNEDELAKMVFAAVSLQDWGVAIQLLTGAEDSGRYAPMFLRDLKDMVSAKKRIKQ
jgi:hypothetical protein